MNATAARRAVLTAVFAAAATGCLDERQPTLDIDGPDARVADGAAPDTAPDPTDAALDGTPDAVLDRCAEQDGLIEVERAAVIERVLCPLTDRVLVYSPRAAVVTAVVESTVDMTLIAEQRLSAGVIPVDRLELRAHERATLTWINANNGLTLAARAVEPGAWRLTVTVDAPPSDAYVNVRGRLTGWDRPLDADDLGPPTPMLQGGARVDLVDGEGRFVSVDHTGPDGRFDFHATYLPPGTPVTVRVVAQSLGAGVAVQVGPEAGLPWAEPVAEFVTRPDNAPIELDVALDPDGPTTAALHIARVAAAGLDRIAPHLTPVDDPPPVVYRWRPGFSAPCGSCFRPGPAPVIDLGGQISDPDEWDDAVILHELGHHLAAVYSRDDSPGGPHAGDRTDPVIAWSEGFATFHAGWQLGTSTQLDYKITGVTTLDLEPLDDPRAYGTDGDTLDGAVSERLVAAVLWDLYDGAAAPDDEDDDPAAIGDDTLTPVFGPLADPSADRGAAGIDLADYLDVLWCPLPPIGAEAILDDRAYPYTAPDCRAKSAEPLTVERTADGYRLTPAIDGRLVLRDDRVEVHPARAGEPIDYRPAPGARVVSAELHHPAGRAVVPIRWTAPKRAPRPYRRRAGAYELVPE